jgi:hypothetical protein
MREAIPSLPNTLLWRGAQLKHRGNFTFTLLFIIQKLNTVNTKAHSWVQL